MSTHKDLHVWTKGMEIARYVQTATKSFPRDELYGMTSQMRRAAYSIPSNIAEGAARRSTVELRQFLYIALGSASELETQAILSHDFGYLPLQVYETLSKMLNEEIKMISALIDKCN
ncbi:MAG: four helix bundle protein [Alloprevotella sp.]|nr:four helix bundle protein [Bacteroidales bacterium]MBR1652624.1 four helix bundle protein [Alloprevotella sp.]